MPLGNVLVVEDDESIRRLLVEYFNEQSLLADVARDGAEALHRISAKHYAVIVLDVMMPHMSGIDLLESLQALLSDPSLETHIDPPAVLVVTSIPPQELPSRELQNRFPSIVRDVLRKPVDVGALVTRVESLLAKHV